MLSIVPDAGDGVANRNHYIAIYRYCNSPNCYSDAVDCMQTTNTMDTLDMPVASNDSRTLMDTRAVSA